MNAVVQDLERRLDGAASSGRADNPQAARELAGAANQIRESKLKEKLQYTRGTIEQWDPESAVTMELQIEGDLQALRDQLERARAASSERQTNPLEEALDETRDLVRGVEAMDRRLTEPGQQGQGGQEGETGQQGEAQGQQGEGEQGEGQQGEGQGEGQQGEGQQGEGQGEGQQGEGQQGEGQQGQGQGEGQQGQGQGDQQGQGGGQGQGGDGTVGDRYAGSQFGGATRGNPRRLTPDEIRQYQNEFRQREGQVRELSDQLTDAGRSVEELRGVLEAFQRLQDDDIYADPAALAELHGDMLDRLKMLEFGLRREVEGEAERRATLTGADEVPDGYRRLVEEYYRALARGGSGPGGN
jgi:hypothetical protein